MCHQASFYLNFARKYPLFDSILHENWVVFKTGSGKKNNEKGRCGIIPDMLTLAVSNSISSAFKHWKMFILYDRHQCEPQHIVYGFHKFLWTPSSYFRISNTDALLLKLVNICSCCKLDQQATATFCFKKDVGQTNTNYCSEISKREGTNLIISP